MVSGVAALLPTKKPHDVATSCGAEFLFFGLFSMFRLLVWEGLVSFDLGHGYLIYGWVRRSIDRSSLSRVYLLGMCRMCRMCLFSTSVLIMRDFVQVGQHVLFGSGPSRP